MREECAQAVGLRILGSRGKSGAMSGSERKQSAFSLLLQESAASIAETLTLFNEPAPCGARKAERKEVITAAEGVAKHATTAGVLWKGKVSRKEGLENISSYIQALQGFLLLSHGTTAGAGSTLLSCIAAVSRQVANSSLNLLRDAVSGLSNRVQDVDLPVLVGCVWEACEAVKKAPTSNRVAIGRSLTQVAISVKDVLRELGDFEQVGISQCTSNAVALNALGRRDGINHENVPGTESETSSLDESTELSNKLSAGEMQVVQAVKDFGLALLSLIKQLLHIVAGTTKGSTDTQMADAVATPLWEKVLELSKAIGVGVDELGASLYPPQEIDNLQGTVAEIEGLVQQLQVEVYSLVGSIPEEFLPVLNASKDSACALNRILDTANHSVTE